MERRCSSSYSEDQSVVLQYGDKTYGPYTMLEDPTAVPKNEEAEGLTGIEIRNGDQVFFRGGVFILRRRLLAF